MLNFELNRYSKLAGVDERERAGCSLHVGVSLFSSLPVFFSVLHLTGSTLTHLTFFSKYVCTCLPLFSSGHHVCFSEAIKIALMHFIKTLRVCHSSKQHLKRI